MCQSRIWPANLASRPARDTGAVEFVVEVLTNKIAVWRVSILQHHSSPLNALDQAPSEQRPADSLIHRCDRLNSPYMFPIQYTDKVARCWAETQYGHGR